MNVRNFATIRIETCGGNADAMIMAGVAKIVAENVRRVRHLLLIETGHNREIFEFIA
jgi:hypothetical protein